MKHRRRFKRLGHKEFLFNNMLKSLFQHGKIVSTLTKIKSFRPFAERTITKAIRVSGLAGMRDLTKTLNGDFDFAKKISEESMARCKDRKGGYLRIIKLGFRSGDKAPTALIEFVDELPVKVNKA